jgi:threonine dehydratase
VVGVEAEASPQISAAVAAGRVVPVEIGTTIADALAGNIEARSVTPDIARRTATRLLSVSEPELAVAVRFLSLRCGLTVEGAGAAGVAAVLGGHLDPAVLGERLVIVITGRNIAADQLRDLLSSGH